MHERILVLFLFLFSIVSAAVLPARAQQTALPPSTEGDFVVKNFKFHTGEIFPEIRFHYTTLGQPVRDDHGRINNAILILHGTGASGRQFLQPQFAGELFGKGQLLDASRYYIILPDGIGHGKSSKPSDGLRSRFPNYGYEDMVAAHYSLLAGHLGVGHLRLILGTSMGCMQTFVWAEVYRDFMDALMPLGCLPVEIAGRNRIWRKMAMDAIRSDPEWKGGDYTHEPQQGLRTALDLLLIACSEPLLLQETLPTRQAADEYLDQYFRDHMPGLDANDLLYQIDASRDYNPLPLLGKIRAPVMYVNSADDFINPLELGIAERAIKQIKNASFVLIPVSDKTHVPGTHTWAALWRQYLAELLVKSERPRKPAHHKS